MESAALSPKWHFALRAPLDFSLSNAGDVGFEAAPNAVFDATLAQTS
jgi:hypothetical protein